MAERNQQDVVVMYNDLITAFREAMDLLWCDHCSGGPIALDLGNGRVYIPDEAAATADGDHVCRDCGLALEDDGHEIGWYTGWVVLR